MKILKIFSFVIFLTFLSSCGGGGGSTGKVPGVTDPVVTPTVADAVFELDKSTIVNTGTDTATITVTVLDANRNVMAGVPVNVSLSPDGVFRKSGGNVTDSKGQFAGLITIGANKANRVITATVVVGTITRVASVSVVGSQIVLTPVPATPKPGDEVTLNIATRDSSGSVIPNILLTLKGTAFPEQTARTDLSGNAIVKFTAPAKGSYTIIVDALGTVVTKNLEVVDGSDSGKPPANGEISSFSLTPNPTSIQTNIAGSTANRSKLSVKFQDGNNQGIENMRVRFEVVPPTLGNGESISTGDSTVYTDSTGVAVADYIAGVRSSPTNGVKVRACYSKTDFSSSSDCPNEVAATLTVSGTPLSISISDNNLLEKGLGNISYIKKFLIQVNDSAGVAVKDAIISASVDITHYGKSLLWGQTYQVIRIPNIRYIHSDYSPSPEPANAIADLQISTSPPLAGGSIWCLNEDWNRNGFLDQGEDINKDSSIQPRKAEIIVSYVGTNKTNENGQLLLQVSYGQNMGRWLAYTLRVTTSVAGSEGDAAKSYVTDVLEGDVENGSFLTPPFGSGACTDPN
ncbi:MAG: hypothetical protein RLZZ352_604 [Pseudomonadota bacterium]